jgi:hypothetical protein
MPKAMPMPTYYPLGDAEVLSHGDEVQLALTATNYDGLRVGSRLKIRRYMDNDPGNDDPNKKYHVVSSRT